MTPLLTAALFHCPEEARAVERLVAAYVLKFKRVPTLARYVDDAGESFQYEVDVQAEPKPAKPEAYEHARRVMTDIPRREWYDEDPLAAYVWVSEPDARGKRVVEIRRLDAGGEYEGSSWLPVTWNGVALPNHTMIIYGDTD